MQKNRFTRSTSAQLTKKINLASATYIAQSTADRISTIDTPNANTFLDSMKLDQFGNLSVDETVQCQNFTWHLSNTHRPHRNEANQEKPEQLKTKFCEIRLM